MCVRRCPTSEPGACGLPRPMRSSYGTRNAHIRPELAEPRPPVRAMPGLLILRVHLSAEIRRVTPSRCVGRCRVHPSGAGTDVRSRWLLPPVRLGPGLAAVSWTILGRCDPGRSPNSSVRSCRLPNRWTASDPVTPCGSATRPVRRPPGGRTRCDEPRRPSTSPERTAPSPWWPDRGCRSRCPRPARRTLRRSPGAVQRFSESHRKFTGTPQPVRRSSTESCALAHEPRGKTHTGNPSSCLPDGPWRTCQGGVASSAHRSKVRAGSRGRCTPDP
jgi:hypothetical protein